jgi:hypothetical protein
MASLVDRGGSELKLVVNVSVAVRIGPLLVTEV